MQETAKLTLTIDGKEQTIELPVVTGSEGEKAIDVFHITKSGVKLTEPEQQALTSDLQRTLEDTL